MINNELDHKYAELLKRIAELKSVAVAFSSGVDSAFLLYAAKEALGDNVVALTGVSPFFPEREKKEAQVFCQDLGVKQILVEIIPEDIPEFSNNSKNRCYYCKRYLFTNFITAARNMNIYSVIDGTNADDTGDFRPGMRALEELNIVSPLKDAGFSKKEIRELSVRFGLSTWDKPSFACLASRIPYGQNITVNKLSMVEHGENYLLELGFKQFRVRLHEDISGSYLARIEVLSEDMKRLNDERFRHDIYARFKELGFAYTSMDLMGFRSGSLNETIKNS